MAATPSPRLSHGPQTGNHCRATIRGATGRMTAPGPASNDFAKEHGMRLSRTPRILIAVCLVTFGLSTLQGCQESEQDRQLTFKKGTYMGKPDQKLSASQEDALRYRAKITQGN